MGGQPTGYSATIDGRGCSLGATLSKIKENPNFCIPLKKGDKFVEEFTKE